MEFDPTSAGFKRKVWTALWAFSIISLVFELLAWLIRAQREKEMIVGVVFIFVLSLLMSGAFPRLVNEQMEQDLALGEAAGFARPWGLVLISVVVMTALYFAVQAAAVFLNGFGQLAVISWLSSNFVLGAYAVNLALLLLNWFSIIR